MCDVVLGSQWGDEGKGKLVDLLCDDIDVCARCAGGNNAGHTIVVGKTKYDFHMLPSGLVNPNCKNLVGSGVVIHVPSFFQELENLEAKGLDCRDRLFVSSRAHLVFDFHQRTDKLKEAELSTNKRLSELLVKVLVQLILLKPVDQVLESIIWSTQTQLLGKISRLDT